ncbi:MAG: serine/threonine-protein kinase, partial [Bacteroidota bacterium]
MPSWEEIEAVFDAVLDAPAHERPMVLDHLTAGKPELRAEVTSLLAAHEASGGEDDPFTGSAGTFAAPFVAAELAAEEASLRPTQIGRYRIVDEIGRGGMGAVYLAERADGQFEQQVALKLIKLGTDSELVRQRFLNERQILARLQHPNIARLLDGGTEESTGRPYFVMEYVHGQPIAAYARQNQLSIDRRLSLFLDVCEAVQFAHRNLIVHRDLKPSNILVTEQGQARLLDFGIAKMLAEDDGPALTRTGGQLMTPEYAAPEQISGGDTTTATDVYALGLLLYELLTGQRAQQFDSQAPSVIERVICDTEPPRPSTTSRLPHISARRLAGDLDTIVLKALQKSPERRYASAEALAA